MEGLSKILLFTIIIQLQINPMVSQNKTLPNNVQLQIDNYTTTAIKSHNAGNQTDAATLYNKIAYLYWEYHIYNKAIENFEHVLVINQNQQNKNGVQKVTDNMAFVYSDMERYDKAIEYFLKSQQILTEIGNKEKIAAGYANISSAYSDNGLYNQTVEYALKGVEISKEINNIRLLRQFYGLLYDAYQKLDNPDKTAEYFSLYSSLDKHIRANEQKQTELAAKQEIEKIESEKRKAVTEKEKTQQKLEQTRDTLKEFEQISREQQLSIDLLNAEKIAKELQLQAERRMRTFFIVLMLFLAGIILLVYTQMQQKKRANIKLKELNNEIEKKNRQILDSINYASHIQESVLPYQKSISEFFPGSFILYKPRDIVSGDFYWFTQKNGKTLIAAIDCTGHGVPGAFMSMIGNTLLNEIVNEKNITDPANVLMLMNKKVVETLNQNSGEKESFSEDGMDITLCCIDTINKKAEVAMANHSIVVFQNNNMQLIEGDIYSVGGNVGNIGQIKFTGYSIDLTKPTNIYMFSDGYQDQYSDIYKRKYMASNFYNKLTEIQALSFDEQLNILEIEIDKFKGGYKQVDDILVIGLKIVL